MHAHSVLLLLLGSFLLFGCSRPSVAVGEMGRDLCDCGPDVCLNDPRYPPKVAKKKADLRKAGFPDDLVALLDRDGKCVMAIDQSPDAFRLLLVEPNGNNSSISWTQQDEDLARKEILDGRLKEYYKNNVRKVFACCKEPKAEDRNDWDSSLSLSRNLSIRCAKANGNIVCK